MKIIIQDKLGKEFIFKYLPTYIIKKVIISLYNKKNKIKKLLEENNYTLEKFIEEFKKSFSLKKFGNYYILSIKEGNINRLIRIIDYGSIGFKPQHIFDKLFKYISSNLGYLHNMYLHYIPV